MFLAFLLFTSSILTNAVDIISAISDFCYGAKFEISGITLTQGAPKNFTFTIMSENGEGGIDLIDRSEGALNQSLKIGDVVQVTGHIDYSKHGALAPICDKLTIRGHISPPQPIEIDATMLNSGEYDFKPIQIKGVAREIFRDKIDAGFIFIILSSNGQRIFAALRDLNHEADSLKKLTDHEISLVGIASIRSDGQRKFNGRIVHIQDINSIRVINYPPSDPFAVPVLDNPGKLTPIEIANMRRRRLIGSVLAIYRKQEIILLDEHNIVHKVSLRDRVPTCGESIEVVGTPETDLYRINLFDALWRPVSNHSIPINCVTNIASSDLFSEISNTIHINSEFYGKTVRIIGTIIDVPKPNGTSSTIELKSDGYTVNIDIDNARELISTLPLGSVIAATGVCVIDSPTWQPHITFPHTSGLTIVTRNTKDITVLDYPSWWTPQRLQIAIGLLLIILTLIFIWNRILRQIIDRKSRQLLKEQIGKMRAALRVDERTHLAVELHDSLSQNLSGVACQIAATKTTLPKGAHETERYLTTAERMLLSCRTELRRCLWDLRGNALEVRTFDEAIRQSLAPIAIGVETRIRFNVPRIRLSDTTAHSVLCIIRELVANAVRHGKPSIINIAGELHDNILSFSVKDNGSGFDPQNCVGPTEGHFGLEGIRGRVKRLDGQFSITSNPRQGTRAVITLKTPQQEHPIESE